MDVIAPTSLGPGRLVLQPADEQLRVVPRDLDRDDRGHRRENRLTKREHHDIVTLCPKRHANTNLRSSPDDCG